MVSMKFFCFHLNARIFKLLYFVLCNIDCRVTWHVTTIRVKFCLSDANVWTHRSALHNVISLTYAEITETRGSFKNSDYFDQILKKQHTSNNILSLIWFSCSFKFCTQQPRKTDWPCQRWWMLLLAYHRMCLRRSLQVQAHQGQQGDGPQAMAEKAIQKLMTMKWCHVKVAHILSNLKST